MTQHVNRTASRPLAPITKRSSRCGIRSDTISVWMRAAWSVELGTGRACRSGSSAGVRERLHTRRCRPTESGEKVPTVATLARIVRTAGFSLDLDLSPVAVLPDRRARSGARRSAGARRTVSRSAETAGLPTAFRPNAMSGLPRKIIGLHTALASGEIRAHVRRHARAGLVYRASSGDDRHRPQCLCDPRPGRRSRCCVPACRRAFRVRCGDSSRRRAGPAVVGRYAH